MIATTTLRGQRGNIGVVPCMVIDVYPAIRANNITMSVVLLLLHLYGWNLATRANVNTKTSEAA